jgi:hypothetical protein
VPDLFTPEHRKAETEGLIGMGMILLVLFTSTFLVAASLGLVATDDRPGIFARIVMFGFGGTLLAVGCFLAWRIASELMDHPPEDGLGLAYRLVTGALGRIELRSVGGALVIAPLLWFLLTPGAPLSWWRPSRESLIALVPLEFLVIHGFPFLVFLALLVRGTARWARAFWAAVLLLFMGMYGALAWQEAEGLTGVIALLWLITPNILAFLNGADAWHQRVAAVARWLIRLVVFFGMAIILDHRSLRGEGNLALGAAYFGAILLLELLRIFDLPLDIAARWATLPADRRRHLLPREG